MPVAVDARQLATLQAQVKPVLAMSEAEMLTLIPTQSGLYFVGCPVCHKGVSEEQLSVWDISRPNEVRCAYCGTVFPNAGYPMTGVQTVTNPRGETQTYPYWADASGYRYYFAARIDYHKIRYMENCADALGQLYTLTGNATYARRAALILARFAEVFCGYCYHYDYPFAQKIIYSGTVAPSSFLPGFRTARWTWWAYMDVPRKLALSYDRICPSGALETLADETRTDVKQTIEAMLADAADQVIANQDDLTNMSPYAWADLIVAGRVLERPDYVHTAVERLHRMATEQFFFDGIWREGAPSYHQQVLNSFRSMFTYARGYSDPPDYTTPEGVRFDNLDLENSSPLLVRMRRSLADMRLPDGRYVPVHDTWWDTAVEAPTVSQPRLLGGVGHAILGRGAGVGQQQLHLSWSPGYGHSHDDGLNLTFFAQQHELLSDIGYTHTNIREWTLATAAHNTVVMNQREQTANANTFGALRFYDAADPGCQLVSVDNPQVYAGLATLYRRTVALIAIDGARSYAFDLFQAKGGATHDYFLHGSADVAQTLTARTASSLTKMTALKTLMPSGIVFTQAINEQDFRLKQTAHAYGYLTDLQQSRLSSSTPLMLDYQGGSNTRVWLFPKSNDLLVLGRDPAIRGAEEDSSKTGLYKRAFAMLRRGGGNSVFASIIEPSSPAPTIQSTRKLSVSGAALAVEVTLPNRHDIILFQAKNTAFSWRGAKLQATAELVVLSEEGGVVRMATVVNGSLRWGLTALATTPVTPHRLYEVVRSDSSGSLLVDGTFLPAPGSVITINHAGGRVTPVTVASSAIESNASRIYLTDDPGFTWDAANQASTLTYLPLSSFTGTHTVGQIPVAHLPVP